jgi:hypothetical protein
MVHPVEYVRTGLVVYVLSSLVVVVGVVAGDKFFRPRHSRVSDGLNLTDPLLRWDGQWYQRIVVGGYSYDPEQWSNVAFFPVYPSIASLAVNLIGVTPPMALVIVAHVSLAGAFVLLGAYVRHRYWNEPWRMTPYVLLALGLAPFSFYFRMAYSEAPFLLLTILSLYGMERRWSLLTVAFIIGLATATRPVGVGVIAPLLLYMWGRSSTRMIFVGNCVCIMPIACWGLIAFMFYQCGHFGDPLAFAKSHATWRVRPLARFVDKLLALETLEPIWSVFVPSSPCFSKRSEPSNSLLFNPAIFNRMWFVLAVILAVVGKYKRWLSSYELALVASLLFIPYVGRGYEMCMASMARFTSVAFPIYLVLGNLLWRMPAPLAAGILSISSLLLGIYAALFAASYPFF